MADEIDRRYGPDATGRELLEKTIIAIELLSESWAEIVPPDSVVSEIFQRHHESVSYLIRQGVLIHKMLNPGGKLAGSNDA